MSPLETLGTSQPGTKLCASGEELPFRDLDFSLAVSEGVPGGEGGEGCLRVEGQGWSWVWVCSRASLGQGGGSVLVPPFPKGR